MTLRRFAFAMLIVCGLGVGGLVHSSDSPAPSQELMRAESAHGNGNHDEAAARYRNGQSSHWRHVMVGNYSCDR